MALRQPRLSVKLDRTKEIEAKTMLALARAVLETAHNIEARAKGRAPVRTGFLRNSIQTHRTGLLEAEIQVGAEYGMLVEHGTRHTPARPFLRPSVTAERPLFLERIQRAGASVK
jgi:HK97 gp10 family phage protein